MSPCSSDYIIHDLHGPAYSLWGVTYDFPADCPHLQIFTRLNKTQDEVLRGFSEFPAYSQILPQLNGEGILTLVTTTLREQLYQQVALAHFIHANGAPLI